MIKFYIFDKCSDRWSEPFNTREEAQKALDEDKHTYSLDAEILEIEER